MTESKIYFKFDGKKYAGNQGDTIAAALLRNNVRLIGRSFKYHRPRGIYTCGIEEPNALFQIINEHNEPNVRATVKKIYEGMIVKSQNRWPSLKIDLGSINNILSPIFSAGFYYESGDKMASHFYAPASCFFPIMSRQREMRAAGKSVS